jgi:hypothetical protein
LVISWLPKRTRMPEAPARERAGGLISAGMISTVHTPLPSLAQTVPKVWPAFWAPSPESETISTMRSFTTERGRIAAGTVSEGEGPVSWVVGIGFPRSSGSFVWTSDA